MEDLMKKFAFIGAGSFAFTRNLVRDLLTFPAFEDCEIALMDIDPDRLDRIKAACEKIVATMNKPARLTATLNRAEALTGADGVLCTVFNGDVDIWKYDIEIPKKYGVDINIGDTRSVSGIFRALRNIPLMLEICSDIEHYCPNAVFLNYTNPMSMLCKAMQTYAHVEVTGLCHSVTGTIKMLAEWLNIPHEDVTYLCAGVNHQAFYLNIERDGQDLYPLLREKIEEPEYYNKEIVRNEMFRHLGYYVTESSGHNSEYNQWFRKRPDLIEKYCTHGTNWNPGLYAYSLDLHTKRKYHWKEEINDWIDNATVDPKRSLEYAANIFNARFGDHTPFQFNGNVINHSSIANLPADACVEIPVLADKSGFRQMMVGTLPAHLAILVNTTAGVENLVVEAAMQKSREAVFHAVCMDPLTSAVCSLDEIKQMCDELFEANKNFLAEYK
ncbi:MAG TPA: alpha-galactosidase [Armatimonadota bacterium]|nr:alpha-galactosidase [Armatimonadota bacterium]